MNLQNVTEKQIFERIKEGLFQVTRLPKEGIRRDAQLIKDLGLDSIDFTDFAIYLDIHFDEKELGEELLQLYKSRPEKPKEDLVKDGIITDKGMEMIKKKYPHGDFQTLEITREYDDLDTILTVGSIVSYVQERIRNNTQI